MATPAGVRPEWHLQAPVGPHLALPCPAPPRALPGVLPSPPGRLRTGLSREPVGRGAMVAVPGSAGWSPGTAWAGGDVPCLGLRFFFPFHPPGPDLRPVSIPGPASTVSGRLGDPQWRFPRRAAGKRPRCRAPARAAGIGRRRLSVAGRMPACPWAAFPSDGLSRPGRPQPKGLRRKDGVGRSLGGAPLCLVFGAVCSGWGWGVAARRWRWGCPSPAGLPSIRWVLAAPRPRGGHFAHSCGQPAGRLEPALGPE